MLICLLFEKIKNEIPNTMGERSITDSTISRFSNYKYINILNIFILNIIYLYYIFNLYFKKIAKLIY